MNALVISGGGSKGAFAGGVAQFLIEELGKEYQLYLGTSTGSILVPHLALDKIEKIKGVYTSVTQSSIFDRSPFILREKHGEQRISIHHFNVLRNFIHGRKTFGESHNLLQVIRNTFTEEEFATLQSSPKELIVTVSNISMNRVEYKSINDFSYDDFCDWIWISCNYTPFMSLVKRNGCEYADGGLGCSVPIEEAVRRGATEIDAIVLETEITQLNRMPSRNVFSLLTNIFGFMADRIEYQNIRIGKFAASHHNVIINFYYTPIVLTTNSLVFNKEKMKQWWKSGYEFARQKNKKADQMEI